MDEYIDVQVPGAGFVRIGNFGAFTGGAVGFSFDASWSRFGLSGGILGINEAKRLANYILEKCEKESKTEDELIVEKLRQLTML